jgi:hypothetical protein
MVLLLDLADVARTSGLFVVELAGWKANYSPGGFDPDGVLMHHTGGYDGIADPNDDLDYAHWLAFEGRDDLDPPLCNLALSAESVVYVCSSGNANHAGRAKASGPMPAADDGNRLYVGIEAMNSGLQGWNAVGRDVFGDIITQREGYERLAAALSVGYDWPASHVRGHKETSVTGKIDPGLLDMDQFRYRVNERMQYDMLTPEQEDRLAAKTAKATVDLLMAYKPGLDDDTVKQILNRLSTSQERD